MAPKSLSLTDLSYDFPDRLIATEPKSNYRIMRVQNDEPKEINHAELLNQFESGDLLVINNTRVIPRRVFFNDQSNDVLFLQSKGGCRWEVMTLASQLKKDTWYELQGGAKFRLLETGRPQTIETDFELPESYFVDHGALALPPYILKMRNSRAPQKEDSDWYQTEWASISGSVAAPTASLHFSNDFLLKLKAKGVIVKTVTLHVGAGTFLPIKAENLNEHHMHSEWCEVPLEVQKAVTLTKQNGGKVWALGTTSTRALESWSAGMLNAQPNGAMIGETKLFIRPGFEFKVVDGLLTNFHQPQSTLLALVIAFAGYKSVMSSYEWAIKNEFRLFSYGDLTVWNR